MRAEPLHSTTAGRIRVKPLHNLSPANCRRPRKMKKNVFVIESWCILTSHMADIQVTDDLGKSAPNVKIDLSQPSSLLKYAKTELLHLAVAPDFIERAPQPLTT